VADEKEKLKTQKNMRKMTKVRLKNIGLYYLKRFESSVANLRQVLRRRVYDYAHYNNDFDKQEAFGWIEELLADFERLGYIDDARYCEMKVKTYLSAGKSPRYIVIKLREKGIDENLINKIMDEQSFDPYEGALKLARKKRIGPYSATQEIRKERKSKDLAVLLRAGFDYDVVMKVLELEEV